MNEEKNLKHKCWLLLAYCSGLRAEEVASVRYSHIYAHEHKLKVLGKGKKERFTVLPDITIKYLRLYYKSSYNRIYYKSDYLFGGYKYNYISSKTIVNYFITIKEKYNLDEELTFHSLRHSFATNFIKAGGDPFVLKSMLGHASLMKLYLNLHKTQNG